MPIRKPTKQLRRSQSDRRRVNKSTRTVGGKAAADPRVIGDVFQVVAECHDEEAQRELYERLRGEGYQCRLLLL
jgi:hypothetical protein